MASAHRPGSLPATTIRRVSVTAVARNSAVVVGARPRVRDRVIRHVDRQPGHVFVVEASSTDPDGSVGRLGIQARVHEQRRSIADRGERELRLREIAARELALGIEGLERFVRKEPLRRVHECVFAVLALESEPVDPRL